MTEQSLLHVATLRRHKLERLGAKTLTDMDYLTDGEFGELGLSPDKEAVVRGHLRSLARR